MDQGLFLLYSLPRAIYSLSVGLAVSLFFAFYIAALVVQARKEPPVEPVRFPAWLPWLAFMYPRWLDRLTFLNILKAFFEALVVAVVAWTLTMVVLIMVIATVHSP